MLSYRHAFHAGNHADVLKHLVEVLVLEYLVQKEGKPLRYIDTHAGPGMVDLRGRFASLNREFDSGIGQLWQQRELPPPLASYVKLVRGFSPAVDLVCYPGSPAIAARILHPGHRLQLFELHPDDASRLSSWSGGDRRIRVQQQDGFAALKAILPPPEKRALVMIDPPYEIKSDYDSVIAALQLARRKFATGVYLLWYPLLHHDFAESLVKKLCAMPVNYLLAELSVRAPAAQGMYGSGVFVINPPWVLQAQLESSLPFLQAALATTEAPPYRLLVNAG